MSHLKKTTLELTRITAEDYRALAKLPVTVILDNVRSEMNVGSIFRTADAFLVDRLCLCGITPTPPAHEIHKTALGAELTVAWTRHDTVADAIALCRERGDLVMAVEQTHGSVSLGQWTVPRDRGVAIILGNEVKGVQQQAIDACDGALELSLIHI